MHSNTLLFPFNVRASMNALLSTAGDRQNRTDKSDFSARRNDRSPPPDRRNDSFRAIADADSRRLWAMRWGWISRMGSKSSPRPVAADGPVMRAGSAVYADECSASHTANGSGVVRSLPAWRAVPPFSGHCPTRRRSRR